MEVATNRSYYMTRCFILGHNPCVRSRLYTRGVSDQCDPSDRIYSRVQDNCHKQWNHRHNQRWHQRHISSPRQGYYVHPNEVWHLCFAVITRGNGLFVVQRCQGRSGDHLHNHNNWKRYHGWMLLWPITLFNCDLDSSL